MVGKVICASAKTAGSLACTIWGMDPHPILLFSLINHKISDLFTEYPQLMRVFMKSHAACVGCVFSAYCVLRDALDFYQLDPAVLLKDITNPLNFEN